MVISITWYVDGNVEVNILVSCAGRSRALLPSSYNGESAHL
jgi:hypothetical protein